MLTPDGTDLILDATSMKNIRGIIGGVIRKFAEKCYQIALLLSISMKIHRYKLPFIAS